MVITFLFYIIMKLIGVTTKILFKTDVTSKIREELKKEYFEYLTTPYNKK